MAKKEPVKQSAYESGGRIQVRVSDFSHGLRVIDGVKLVRLKGRDYNLLIMEDYFPLLGKTQGHVELVTTDDLVNLGEVKGFYMHRDNEFSLLIEEQLAPPAEKQESGHER